MNIKVILQYHFLTIHLSKLLNFDNIFLPSYWGNMFFYKHIADGSIY